MNNNPPKYKPSKMKYFTFQQRDPTDNFFLVGYIKNTHKVSSSRFQNFSSSLNL